MTSIQRERGRLSGSLGLRKYHIGLVNERRYTHQVIVDPNHARNGFGGDPDGLPLLVGFRKAQRSTTPFVTVTFRL